MYLQICKLNFILFFLFFPEIRFFWRFSGAFNGFLLVYTTILEQKRIAGQEENVFILILF